ncbi:hypothetical protein Cni_G27895 [Canna indica]|uniref:Ribosomal protein S21 n=1 Tax=Canna indica TaxID=4628 RepID=A0AAQ3L1M9_9LILI|nr:hypothetical protein Cni_G27895 [Canna indica]
MVASTANLLQLPFAKTLAFPSPRPTSRRPFPFSSSFAFTSLRIAAGCAPVDPAVVNPAPDHANFLLFSSGYNVQIVVDEGESEEALLRRFRREVSKAGVIQECKRRRFFENKQDEKKRRAREAGKRNRRRRSGPRFSSAAAASSGDNDSATKEANDDLDDNWDLPEGDLPY